MNIQDQAWSLYPFKAKKMRRPITKQYHHDYVTLNAHMVGGRPLSEEYPPSHLRWVISFAFVDLDVPLTEGDDQYLYTVAEKRGQPLRREETRSLLLERRLAGKVP